MKKINILVFCVAAVCSILICGTLFTATALQEDSSPETQVEDVPEPEPSEPDDTTLLPSDPEIGSPDDSSLETVQPAESSDDADEDGVDRPITDITTVMQEAHDRLDAHITETAHLLGMPEDYVLDLGEDNFFDALAVYAIRRNQTANFPFGMELTEEEDQEELISIYWSMNPVQGANTEVGSVIQIRRIFGENDGGLLSKETTQFLELYTMENREMVTGLLHA